MIYTLTQLGTLWDDRALLAEAEALVALLPTLIAQDDHLDVMGGAAGCIGGLLALHHRSPSTRTLAVALACGEHLVARAQPMPHGVGWWNRHIPTTQPMTGFSHGAAGVAWALLELAAAIGDERFRATALEGIAYERSLFSPHEGNWADLRDPAILGRGDDERSGFMTAWCHGAPGVGLGRLRSLRHLDDTTVRAEIEAALQTTLAHGFGHNHSLCHGDLGNLEVLLQADETFDDPHWRAQVDRIAAITLDNIDEHGWRCGVPLGVETPGLMTGLAGIGYGLLRLAEPLRVPAVLALAPPCV
jgi:type 2 lantibiotic biosynthesis protein LanM